MLQNIGTTEILIIAGVLLLLFGAKSLPQFAKGLGQAKGEFKKALEDDDAKSKKK